MAFTIPAMQTTVSTPSSPLQTPFSPVGFTPVTPFSPSSTLSPLEAFKSDPVFSPFLSPEFNPAAFTASALSAVSAASSSENLQNAIRLLHQHLRSQILHRHHHLLRQLSSVSDCNASLSLIRSAVAGLQSSLSRLRTDVSAPFRLVRLQTLQLANLHATVDLLQSTVRLLRQTQKLKSLIQTPDFDVSKAAQLYNDIQTLRQDADLSGIAVVDEELGFLSDAAAGIRAEGIRVLERGMDGLNQAEVGSGLQVFYNMGELKPTVEAMMNKYKNFGIKSIGSALDMKAISAGSSGSGRGFGPGGVQRSGLPQIGGGGKAREELWGRMGNCMDQIHLVVIAVWHLQRVLSKKRDPFTHVLFLDEILKDGEPTLTDRVWESLVKSFATQMKSVFTASSFVKEIFTSGYPKLYSMIENLLERISRDTGVKGVLPAIGSDGKNQIITAIEPFQTAFLALCLRRLSELVNNVFPMSTRGTLPSKDQVSKIISRIQEEVEAVKLDANLTLLVLREISKVLLLLAQNAEYQISTGPESRQVIGSATSSQIKNFTLCQHLQDIHMRLTSMVLSLSVVAAEILSPSLGVIYEVACDSLTSLFQAMIDRLENCILRIHDQNFGEQAMDSAVDNSTSSYMDELQRAIIHFRTEFLSRLLPSSPANTVGSTATETICTRLVRRMASRVLLFFVRHAALVRPLSESGKLRMAKDMAELELVVEQNLFPVEQLGAPYRVLRAFRPLIFLETSQLLVSPLLQDLPPSVILHHLYSRGPDALQSPMQRNKLTPSQYSLWLDSQGEDQIWKGIKATLDDYAMNVRSKGDHESSPIYSVMVQIGSSLTGPAASQGG